MHQYIITLCECVTYKYANRSTASSSSSQTGTSSPKNSIRAGLVVSGRQMESWPLTWATYTNHFLIDTADSGGLPIPKETVPYIGIPHWAWEAMFFAIAVPDWVKICIVTKGKSLSLLCVFTSFSMIKKEVCVPAVWNFHWCCLFVV